VSAVYTGLPEAVFDETGFAQEIAAGSDRLTIFRDALKRGTQLLRRRFEQGDPVTELVHGRARLVDRLLQHAWSLHLAKGAGAALIAVGGYGRGELHPFSDIDIMILLRCDDHRCLGDSIELLLTFLWDIGLEVGHSVRTVEDCVREAEQDLSVATNLMEARLLAGPRKLFEQMRAATGPARLWPSPAFFEAKRREQQARYRKFDDTGFNLEPNVKSSPGGLRDIQMVGWVAKREFGDAETLHDLVGQGFLTETEYHSLRDGEALLWKIRFGLHTLANRREDRLLFDYQRTLAEMFGYRDRGHELAVEQFMQRYYRTVMELERLNEMLLQHFEEAILFPGRLEQPERINKRFQTRGGYLEVTQDRVFEQSPAALLEMFLVIQSRPEIKGVRASTVRLVRSQRHLIDDHFRDSLEARSLFMEILRQPKGITHALRRMNRYGILAAYIPAFANIVGRMQYDLFHVYTVDEHTLFLIRNLRRFTVPEHHHEFPLCSRVISTIPKPELLYLAGLFHDIAKGRGGDHSKLGARDALSFCQHHELSNPDSRLVAWLVEKHLVMSLTAQRKDIDDPEVIQAFAEEMADPVRLDYLYLLTVADARATNPGRWNSWRDALLRELYNNTRSALIRGLRNPRAQDEIIQEKQGEALRILHGRKIDFDQAIDLWLSLNVEYFLHSSPDEIAWHCEVIQKATPGEQPLVRVRRETSRGGTEVFLYGPDRDDLFAITTTLLDQLGLNVMDARIITADNAFTLNSFTILDQGKAVSDDMREHEIVETLGQGLRNPKEVDLQVSRRPWRQLKHFPTDTHVGFFADSRNQRTIMRLETCDQPGLLAQVGRAFATCGVRVQNAKIATIGAEVEDLFFITDRDDRPLDLEHQIPCLEQAIRRLLSA
jgi:[protein-PII] uridylyltransferase